MRKRYTLIPNQEQMRIMRKYWSLLQDAEYKFYQEVLKLERKMQKETNIKDIIFFSVDGGYVGIGNDMRTMKLIQSDRLNKKVSVS